MKDVIRYNEGQMQEVGESLKQFGYLPGYYCNTCSSCSKDFLGAKRCFNCIDCAKKDKAAYAYNQEVLVLSGRCLFADDIPADWHGDNIVLIQRSLVVMTDGSSFWVVEPYGGDELYSGPLIGCIEYLRLYELEDDEGRRNSQATAIKVDEWLQESGK